MIVVYTGSIRSGKTTALRARLGGALGVLMPDADGRRHVLNLATGEARPVEVLPQDAAPAEPVAVGRFVFDGAVLAWARGAIRDAVALRPAMLVIDEVGPLELSGRGLEPAVRDAVRLGLSGETRVVLVVRETLLERVVDHYGIRAEAHVERHVPVA